MLSVNGCLMLFWYIKKLLLSGVLIRYAQEYSHPVFLDRETVSKLGRRVVLANVMAMKMKKLVLVRHNPQRLAGVLLRWYSRA
jgi:ribulose 1,5-bisphosphate synthetase/thiazole synthase